MVTCSKCGKKSQEDAEFCINCGTSLYSVERREVRGDLCFSEGKRGRDYLGYISFGFFIIIVGIVITITPNIFSIFQRWIEQLTNKQAWIRPPKGLINSATLFLYLIGVSSFLKAGIRFLVDKGRKQVLTDILPGVASVFFAYLINLYASHVLGFRMVLALETIICGLLVIAYTVVRYVFFTHD
jgi:hypothetical protein